MARSIKKDKQIKALHAGRRVSESGNVYYENRRNRSDKNRTKRFGNGGGLNSKYEQLHNKYREDNDWDNSEPMDGDDTENMANEIAKNENWTNKTKNAFLKYADQKEGNMAKGGKTPQDVYEQEQEDAMFNSQYDKGGKIAEQIEKLKKGIASPALPQQFKDNMIKKLAELEAQKGAMSSPTKTVAVKKAPVAPKAPKKAEPKADKPKIDIAKIKANQSSGDMSEEDCSELLKKKRADAKASRVRSKKRAAQGKPSTLTPAEVVQKTTAKVVAKVATKVEKGESPKRDLSAIFNNFRSMAKELKEYKSQINKNDVRALIAELKKLL